MARRTGSVLLLSIAGGSALADGAPAPAGAPGIDGLRWSGFGTLEDGPPAGLKAPVMMLGLTFAFVY